MSLFPIRPVTQTDIDRAREELERANFKLGKARSRAIMSSAQASADATDLQACVDAAAKAENEFAQLAERFVTPPAADVDTTSVLRSASEIATQAANSGGPVGLGGEPLHDAFRQDA